MYYKEVWKHTIRRASSRKLSIRLEVRVLSSGNRDAACEVVMIEFKAGFRSVIMRRP